MNLERTLLTLMDGRFTVAALAILDGREAGGLYLVDVDDWLDLEDWAGDEEQRRKWPARSRSGSNQAE